MKAIYSFLFAIMICSGARAQTPLEYNDRLIDVTDSLYTIGMVWSDKFKEAMSEKDFTQLSAPRIAMQKFIEKKVKELKVMKDVSGSEEFRKAVMEYLSVDNKIILAGYKPFEKFNATTPKDTVDAALRFLMGEVSKETAALKKIREAQQRYAAKNDFIIDSGKTEEEGEEEEGEEE